MCVRSMRMAMVIGMRMKLRMVTIRCVRKGMDNWTMDKVMTIRRRLLHMRMVTIRCVRKGMDNWTIEQGDDDKKEVVAHEDGDNKMC